MVEHSRGEAAFSFRFVPELGNLIFARNFHPRGIRVQTEREIASALRSAGPGATSAEFWWVIGGSGGLGGAARIALAARFGAPTVSVHFEAPPDPQSRSLRHQLGSAGWHKNAAIDEQLTRLGLTAASYRVDAFAASGPEQLVARFRRDHPGGRLRGLVWAVAAFRTETSGGEVVSGAAKPLAESAVVKTFGRVRASDPPSIVECRVPAATPDEVVATLHLLGGTIVERWLEALFAEGLLAEGFTLLTLGYRGSELNSALYRSGTLGLAKADLELKTRALDHRIRQRLGGRAVCVICPAVPTAAVGAIPGGPLYLAHCRQALGADYEGALEVMQRLAADHFSQDGRHIAAQESLIRLDDRELRADVQARMSARAAALAAGAPGGEALFGQFIEPYQRLHGFGVPGVAYEPTASD